MRMSMENNYDLLKLQKRIARRIPKILNRQMGIIMSDITEGIRRGRTIDGGRMKGLKPATIKAKRKKGSAMPGTALHDQGKLKDAYPSQRATSKRPEAILIAAKSRTDPINGFPGGVAELHHKGGKHHPARPWFGISPAAREKINKLMELEILEALGKNWRKS